MDKRTVLKIIYDPEVKRYVAIGDYEADGLVIETGTLRENLKLCAKNYKVLQEFYVEGE
jgi:hypothetical protein